MEPVIKDHIFYDYIHIKCPELRKLLRQKVNQWLLRDEVKSRMGIREMISKVYRALWGDENEVKLAVVRVAYVWDYAKEDIELCTLNG